MSLFPLVVLVAILVLCLFAVRTEPALHVPRHRPVGLVRHVSRRVGAHGRGSL